MLIRWRRCRRLHCLRRRLRRCRFRANKRPGAGETDEKRLRLTERLRGRGFTEARGSSRSPGSHAKSNRFKKKKKFITSSFGCGSLSSIETRRFRAVVGGTEFFRQKHASNKFIKVVEAIDILVFVTTVDVVYGQWYYLKRVEIPTTSSSK